MRDEVGGHAGVERAVAPGCEQVNGGSEVGVHIVCLAGLTGAVGVFLFALGSRFRGNDEVRELGSHFRGYYEWVS